MHVCVRVCTREAAHVSVYAPECTCALAGTGWLVCLRACVFAYACMIMFIIIYACAVCAYVCGYGCAYVCVL